MRAEAPCPVCGGTAEVPPVRFAVGARPVRERKPLIDPLWQREWLKWSAGASLLFGALVFLGPTVVLPSAMGKPVEFGPLVLVSLVVTLAQCATALMVLTESEFLNKPAYTSVTTAAFAASVFLGFGDLTNVVLFGNAGGLMLFVRVLNTVALGFALFAATGVKRIPLD